MKSRLTTYTILAALLWAMILPTTVAKPKAPTRASLEQVLKHAPGDMKNDYITSAMIQDSHILILPTLQVTDSIVLHDMRLYNNNSQTSPLVLNLAAFAQLGVARIHPSKNQIEIYERK